MSGQQQRSNDRFADYIPVAERLEKFYEKHPDGRVMTYIIEHDQAGGFVLMRAEVYRSPDDAQPAATGHAFEVRSESYVNKTSYVENCETGAVGRALAMLGFEVKRGVASREEMEKTARMSQPASVTELKQRAPTDAQIVDVLGMLGKTEAGLNEWCKKQFVDFSGDWRAEPADRKQAIHSHWKAKIEQQAAGVK